MKIALAQINTTVGAIRQNSDRVISALAEARQLGADLVVFPELTLTGYPPKDLLEQSNFIQRNIEAMEQVDRATSDGPAALVGFASRRDESTGKGIFNACAFCSGGKIASVHAKTLLPTYDVFDEGRYFDSAFENEVIEIGGKRLGISICEDIWNDELYWREHGKRRYPFDPIEALAIQGFDILINMSASPFSEGKREAKRNMLAATARRYHRPLLHVNLVGGNDSLVFDGWSNVFNAQGEIVAQARDFAESMIIYDTEAGSGPVEPTHDEEIGAICEALTLGIRDYLGKCGFRSAVVGLSGGIDSAVTAALAVRAIGPDKVYGVSMPSPFSSQHSMDDAEALARNLQMHYSVVEIEPVYEAYLKMLHPHFEGKAFDTTEENLQARIRGNILMAMSNKFGHIVLSTGNKSELAVGYCTLYGDMSGGLAVLSDVPKTMVYQLAEYLNRESELIPRSSIDKPPSAELRPGQLDSDSLPPYDILDPIIRAYVEDHQYIDEIVARGYDRATVARVIRMIDVNEYKRQQAATGLKVTYRAFGYGRRMPIACGHDYLR